MHLGEESYATALAAQRLLTSGQTVSIVGRGHSMEPMIPDGTRMILEPKQRKLKKGDVVFARIPWWIKNEDDKKELVWGYLMHLIYVVKFDDKKVLIGNNHGDIDGWANTDDVFGIYIGAIE